MEERWEARVTVCIALILYCASIFFLLLSNHGVSWGDTISMVLAAISIVGLIAWAIPSVWLPGERFAYLITGYTGFTTLLMYLIGTEDNHVRRIGVVTVLLSGTIGAYGAYLNQNEDLR